MLKSTIISTCKKAYENIKKVISEKRISEKKSKTSITNDWMFLRWILKELSFLSKSLNELV